MPKDFQFDVFLSYNAKDEERVRKLARRLKDDGLRVWLDKWIIKPGDDIYLAVEHGLEAARVQVLCLSPAALRSDWVALERSTVLFRDPTNGGRRFIPLLLADSELPDALRRYKYVDFRNQTETALAELVASCRTEAQPTPPEPELEATTKSRTKATKRPTKTKPDPPRDHVEPLAVLERHLMGHKGWVRSVAVSSDGTWAVSGSDD